MFHSIKVKLKQGSIDNIEKFKLFIPRSRNGESEIITAHLFNKMGFLAPRTSLIDLSYNGITYSMVFQEDIDKNFLEYNNIPESMIFEGFENNSLGSPFSVPRISNAKFISDERMLKLALEKYSELAQIYLKSGFLDPRNNNQLEKEVFFNDPIVSPSFFDSRSNNEMTLFSLFSFAANSVHGLSKDDSRFIYEKFSRKFRPIYYDGNSDIGSDTIFNTRPDPIKSDVIPLNFTNSHRSELIKRLENIDRTKFFLELQKLGVKSSPDQVNKKLDVVKNNLVYLKPAKVKDKISSHNTFQAIMDKWNHSNTKENLEFILINDQGALFKCNSINKYNDCETFNSNENNLKTMRALLSQDLSKINLDSNTNIFLGDYKPKKNTDTFNFNKINTNDLPNVDFFVSPNLQLSFNAQKKKITIYPKENNHTNFNSQVLVHGGNIKDWEIEVLPSSFLGYTFIKNSVYSPANISGCITFSDINLDNVSIKMGKSNCEDAINFVRVVGQKLTVDIQDAFSDAIDADFSEIHFNEIKVKSAGNDCVDFSAGEYIIKHANVENCKDKGISVGEKSKVKIFEFLLNNSNIGIVSKDSSIVNIENFNIQNSKYCMATYRKKNEFLGGLINFKKGKCIKNEEYGLFYEQSGSHLNLIQ